MYWYDFLFVRFQIVMEASETETETEMMEMIRLLETGGKRTNRARIGSLEENGEVEIETWHSTNFLSNEMLRELLHPNIQEQKISKLLLQFFMHSFPKILVFIYCGRENHRCRHFLFAFEILFVRSLCKKLMQRLIWMSSQTSMQVIVIALCIVVNSKGLWTVSEDEFVVDILIFSKSLLSQFCLVLSRCLWSRSRVRTWSPWWKRSSLIR